MQIGLFALARREEKIHGNEEACAGRNILFLALQFTNLPDVQWAEDEGPGGDQVQDVDVEGESLGALQLLDQLAPQDLHLNHFWPLL